MHTAKAEAIFAVTAVLFVVCTGFWRQTRGGSVPCGEFVFRCAMVAVLGTELLMSKWSANSAIRMDSWAHMGFEASLVIVASALALTGYFENESWRFGAETLPASADHMDQHQVVSLAEIKVHCKTCRTGEKVTRSTRASHQGANANRHPPQLATAALSVGNGGDVDDEIVVSSEKRRQVVHMTMTVPSSFLPPYERLVRCLSHYKAERAANEELRVKPHYATQGIIACRLKKACSLLTDLFLASFAALLLGFVDLHRSRVKCCLLRWLPHFKGYHWRASS